MIKLLSRRHTIRLNPFVTASLFILLYPLVSADGIATDTVKPRDIFAANTWLSKTINIGFTLDAPIEGAWGHTMNENEFKWMKTAGFTAIRLPIQWVARMDSIDPYQIDTKFLARVDWVVEQALKNNLAIVLDNHLDEQLMANPNGFKNRFLKLWSQLSEHYQFYPQQVMFEIMAEPHGELEKVWEEYFTDALKIIRHSNPNRPVLIGPVLYNLPYKINTLSLPKQDEFIIASFHLYTPIKFTMQGEAWFPMGKPMEWLGTKWLGTDSEHAEIVKFMDMVSSWSILQKKPVFLGEFGVTDHADMASRIRWTAFYRSQAELHNFSWGYWNFAVNYSLFDIQTASWRIELLNALIPPIRKR